MPKEYIMSAEGKKALEERLLKIKAEEMPAAIEEVARARAQGDLSENYEYVTAREHQAALNDEITEIEEKLAYAKIIDEKSVKTDAVSVGSTAVVLEFEYKDGSDYKSESELNAAGFTATDVVEAYLRAGLSKHALHRDQNPILRALTEEQLSVAVKEICAQGRLSAQQLIEAGFDKAELCEKAKGKKNVKINVGSLATENYEIVGSHEADPRNSRISNESPVGAAILGLERGSNVIVKDLIFKVVDITVDNKKKK